MTHETIDDDHMEKIPRRFIQFDGEYCTDEEDAAEGVTDRDGDIISSGLVWEMRRTDSPVRAHVALDADRAEAARVLRKFADWLEIDCLKCRYPEGDGVAEPPLCANCGDVEPQPCAACSRLMCWRCDRKHGCSVADQLRMAQRQHAQIVDLDGQRGEG